MNIRFEHENPDEWKGRFFNASRDTVPNIGDYVDFPEMFYAYPCIVKEVRHNLDVTRNYAAKVIVES